jgi:hypothetical protein
LCAGIAFFCSRTYLKTEDAVLIFLFLEVGSNLKNFAWTGPMKLIAGNTWTSLRNLSGDEDLVTNPLIISNV